MLEMIRGRPSTLNGKQNELFVCRLMAADSVGGAFTEREDK